MSKRPVVAGALALALMLGVCPAAAQWYSPQSDRLLRLNWSAERLGPSRMLILGDVQNLSDQPATRVTLRVEGLDQTGKVVSRARGYVQGDIPPRGASPFEIRFIPSGAERQYRVTVEFFEFREPLRDQPQGS
ncbi:MAG: hypothetical protein HY726_02965 [Candidatus Rokubacteria bacterium]|nr:hypothetical protein [Candidatus Rokubacteria bacterium]